MKARPHSTTVRLTAGDARAILDGLARLRPYVQVTAELDRIAETVAEALPAADRAHALGHYRHRADWIASH